MNNLSSDPVNEFVRRRLRFIRKQKKLSIRAAAKLSHIPESSYSCLENGFYRISLLNLKKILRGLGASIHDVWPSTRVEKLSFKAANVSHRSNLDYHRLYEIFVLSDAEQAALLCKKDSLELIYSINLAEQDQSELRSLLPGALPPDWRSYKKDHQGTEIYLCLKGAFNEQNLKRLIAVYLDYWLTLQFTKQEKTAQK